MWHTINDILTWCMRKLLFYYMFVLPACLFVNTEVPASWLASLTLATYRPAQPVLGPAKPPSGTPSTDSVSGLLFPNREHKLPGRKLPHNPGRRRVGNSQRNPPPCPTPVNLHHTTTRAQQRLDTNLGAQAWDNPQPHHHCGEGQDQEERSHTISGRVPLKTPRTLDHSPQTLPATKRHERKRFSHLQFYCLTKNIQYMHASS